VSSTVVHNFAEFYTIAPDPVDDDIGTVRHGGGVQSRV